MSFTPYGNILGGVYLVDGKSANVVGVDSSTQTIQTIDYAHHEIHDGSYFKASATSDLSINNTLDFLLVTPNTTKWGHFFFTVENESEADMKVYEANVLTSNGTAVSAINKNRNSATTASITAFLYPSIGSTGSQIYTWHSGSGRGGGGSDRNDDEWILKQNSNYLMRITATAAGWVAIRAAWYEHTSK